MPATLKHLLLSVMASTLAAPAAAVGLGPLVKDGLTAGPAKAFYLTVINNGSNADVYRATAIGLSDELPQPRVQIFPSTVLIGGNTTRRILVIAKALEPGETYAFRVCADGKPKLGETIHARVCSKLSARRIADHD